MLHRSVLALVATMLLVSAAAAGDKTKPLEIYWVDVEGGAATLIVTPAGESVLVDTGFPGGRDTARIQKVAKVAGLDRIDHLVVTHYHIDHFGGLAELAALVPIGTLYEHGIDSAPEAERADPALAAYRSARVGRRILVRPGDEVLLTQVAGMAPLRLRFLGARQQFVAPVSEAPNQACQGARERDPDSSDNANSVVLMLDLGHFRFFDGGDLTWNAEGRLVCPADRVGGAVDVLQSEHHGSDTSNNPALLDTLRPTVVVFNNGPRKGGDKASLAAASALPSVQAVYQLHRNVSEGAVNTGPERIANLEENCAGNYVKLSVEPSGKSYTVSVPSTRHQRTYKTKAR
jgi:competence protein ComEC